MPYADNEDKKAYQRKWIAARRARWIEEHGPCAKCGSTEDLEVDHKNRSKKVSEHIWSWSDKRRLPELKKCQVLCRPCHRKKTNKELSGPLIHGTTGGYRRGCRERCCKDARNVWQRAYRASLRT